MHVKNEPRNDYEVTVYNQKDSDSWNGNNYYYKATVKESESDQSSESESDQSSESENNQSSESENNQSSESESNP